MKNYIKDFLLFTLLVISFIYIICCYQYINKQVIYSVDIWLNKVVPILFPTFIIIDIFINSKIPYYIHKYLHINYVYIISILSGSPTNAFLLSKYDINVTKILSVNLYTSPIFLYTFLKMIFNKEIALVLMLLNILSNIILLFMIKPSKINYNYKNNKNVFINSIKNNINILLGILGTIIFFNILPINMINNIYLKSLLFSLLEITSSFNNLLVIDIPLKMKLLFSIISISSCGLCIHMQIKSTLSDTNFNYKYFIKYRLIHLLIYLLLCSFYFVIKLNIFY